MNPLNGQFVGFSRKNHQRSAVAKPVLWLLLAASVLMANWLCASPPVAAAEKPVQPAAGQPVKAQRFDWSQAKAIHPSIRRTSFSVEQPRLM